MPLVSPDQTVYHRAVPTAALQPALPIFISPPRSLFQPLHLPLNAQNHSRQCKQPLSASQAPFPRHCLARAVPCRRSPCSASQTMPEQSTQNTPKGASSSQQSSQAELQGTDSSHGQPPESQAVCSAHAELPVLTDSNATAGPHPSGMSSSSSTELAQSLCCKRAALYPWL